MKPCRDRSPWSCAALTLAAAGLPSGAWAQSQTVVLEQPVTVSEGPRRPTQDAFGGSFARARVGPGLEVEHGAVGGGLEAMLGWENRAGLGLALTLGSRYHTSPSYGVFDVGLGALFRVSALPTRRLHPFGEIGPALHWVHESAGADASTSTLAFGLHAALGLTIDISRRVALDLVGRGEILLRAEGRLQVVLTPVAGVVVRL